jgi:hypothetical protein
MVLEKYEKVSGQRLNKEKTLLFFSHNTEASIKRWSGVSQIQWRLIKLQILGIMKLSIDLRWEAHNNNFVKVNRDFAVDINRMKMGMGELLATLSSPRDYITEPDISKAIAALRAAYLCHELRFYKVVLKGALQVVQAFKKDGRSRSHYGHLIEEA